MQNQQDKPLEPHSQYLPVIRSQQALVTQFFQTSSDVSTPEKLAGVIADTSVARYRDLPEQLRQEWIMSQIYTLCYILHYQQPNALDVRVDATFADQMIMDDEGASALKQVEMQEAFRRGISREYGDFYGITASSLVGFLKAYKGSEKRAQAMALLYNQEQKKLKAEDELFWKTLEEARKNGFEIPTFESTPFEDDKQHQERLARQREEILKTQSHEED